MSGPGDARRWPLAAVLALVLEVVLLAVISWWMQRPSPPAPPPPIRIVLDTVKVAPKTVAPRIPPPPKPAPLPKPRPQPVVHKVIPKPRPQPRRRSVPAHPKFVTASRVAEEQPVPPIVPPSRDLASVRANFEARLRSAIQSAVRYPVAARLMRLTGRTLVMFEFRDGMVSGIRVAKSCGVDLLDRAAERAVRNAPYPPTPADLAGQRMDFEIWVHFRLNDR
ncbi:MAG: energy transducer TonB [Acidiferrobacterales bacterium]